MNTTKEVLESLLMTYNDVEARAHDYHNAAVKNLHAAEADYYSGKLVGLNLCIAFLKNAIQAEDAK